MNWQEKLVNDVRIHAEDLMSELEDIDEESAELNTDRMGMIRRFLDNIDDRLERLDHVGGNGIGGRQLHLPIIFDRGPLKPGTKDYRMHRLHTRIHELWESGTTAYINGNHISSTVTFTVALEGVFKYKFEEEDVEYGECCNLNRCITTAEGNGIIDEESDVAEMAKRVRNIRNDIVHLNRETEHPRSLLAELGLFDETEPIDPDEPMTVIDDQGNYKEIPAERVMSGEGKRIYRDQIANCIVMEIVREITAEFYGVYQG